MNNSKEKAKDIVWKYYDMGMSMKQAKKCALIAVDEILNLPVLELGRMISVVQEDYYFWKEVKQEIEKL